MVSTRSIAKSAEGTIQTEEIPYASNSTLYNLYLLGRIPFCCEAPLWCLLGSLLFLTSNGSISKLTTILSCGLVYLTNVSINYANEYFDFEADSVSQELADKNGSHGGSKMLVNGTFPRWVALAVAAAVQAFILVCIQIDRVWQGEESSLQGAVLWFGLLAMFSAQQYVGPPLRLHYRGGGELISSIEISTGPIAYGYFSQVTTHLRRGLTFTEAYHSMSPAMTLFLAWAFVFELSRIFVMHAADITEDKIAGKHTLVSIIGYTKTKVVYQLTSAIALLLAWLMVLEERRTMYWMVPVYLFAAPIFFKVQTALDGLINPDHASEGKLGFAGMPVLVSLQTLGAPILLSILTIVFKVKI